MILRNFAHLQLEKTTEAALDSVERNRANDGYLLHVIGEGGRATLEFADHEVGGLLQKIAAARRI